MQERVSPHFSKEIINSFFTTSSHYSLSEKTVWLLSESPCNHRFISAPRNSACHFVLVKMEKLNNDDSMRNWKPDTFPQLTKNDRSRCHFFFAHLWKRLWRSVTVWNISTTTVLQFLGNACGRSNSKFSLESWQYTLIYIDITKHKFQDFDMLLDTWLYNIQLIWL